MGDFLSVDDFPGVGDYAVVVELPMRSTGTCGFFFTNQSCGDGVMRVRRGEDVLVELHPDGRLVVGPNALAGLLKAVVTYHREFDHLVTNGPYPEQDDLVAAIAHAQRVSEEVDVRDDGEADELPRSPTRDELADVLLEVLDARFPLTRFTPDHLAAPVSRARGMLELVERERQDSAS